LFVPKKKSKKNQKNLLKKMTIGKKQKRRFGSLNGVI
jgi:hypothetical protein